MADRDRYEDWAKTNIETCPECWGKEQKDKKYALEYSQAQSWEKAVGLLPKLEGSEAQITWAVVIRHNVLGNVISGPGLKPVFFTEEWEELFRQRQDDEHKDAVVYIRDWALPLIAQTSAKWWIDNRNITPIDVFQTLRSWKSVKEEAQK